MNWLEIYSKVKRRLDPLLELGPGLLRRGFECVWFRKMKIFFEASDCKSEAPQLRELENIIIISGGHVHELSAFNYVDGVISVTDFGASQEADEELYAWGMRYFYSGKRPDERAIPMIDKEGMQIAQRIKNECRADVRVFYWLIDSDRPVEF